MHSHGGTGVSEDAPNQRNSRLASLGTAQFCSVTRHTSEWNGRTYRIEASTKVLAVKAVLNAKPFARLKKLTKKFYLGHLSDCQAVAGDAPRREDSKNNAAGPGRIEVLN